MAATKSMIASLVAGASLVAHWSDDDRTSGRARQAAFGPRLIVRRAARDEAIETLAQASSLFVIGRGATHAIAAEAALKLKETSAIHAEAFSSAEVLHGPAGVIGPGFPVLAFAPADAARPSFFDTLDRLATFGAAPLVVDSEAHERWPTVLALDGGHPLADADRGASHLLPCRRSDCASARPRPRPAAASQEGHRNRVSLVRSMEAPAGTPRDRDARVTIWRRGHFGAYGGG